MSEKTVSFGFEDVGPEEKSRRVRGVFASVASRYDVMNDLMSAGVHRLWKSAMIARIAPQPGERLLDVAGGTGDIARAFLTAADARGSDEQNARTQAVVADINEAMLLAGGGAGSRLFRVAADAQRLPFPDRSFDALTISFGIRNVVDPDAALREFRRVLRPGGRFACLEFSHMTNPLLQRLYDSYSFAVIPRLGEWVASDGASYRYLVESIRRFPDQETFRERIAASGFRHVAYQNFSGGIAALHTGWAV
jgi:demethylmenaquinone methyltransferase/2-methoxy-6-polyprenyl-1,4-benzoquinol methylase